MFILLYACTFSAFIVLNEFTINSYGDLELIFVSPTYIVRFIRGLSHQRSIGFSNTLVGDFSP